MVWLVFETTWRTLLEACKAAGVTLTVLQCLSACTSCLHTLIEANFPVPHVTLSLFPFQVQSGSTSLVFSVWRAMPISWLALSLVDFQTDAAPLIISSVDETDLICLLHCPLIRLSLQNLMISFTPSCVTNKQTHYTTNLPWEITSSSEPLLVLLFDPNHACRTGFIWSCWKHTETLVCAEWMKRNALAPLEFSMNSSSRWIQSHSAAFEHPVASCVQPFLKRPAMKSALVPWMPWTCIPQVMISFLWGTSLGTPRTVTQKRMKLLNYLLVNALK